MKAVISSSAISYIICAIACCSIKYLPADIAACDKLPSFTVAPDSRLQNGNATLVLCPS